MMHEKIRPHHLERKAILYVRQSSAHQVLHNRESSTLQYAMRDRLTALGWSRVETVDDDLGRSAAGGVTRAGFDRMGAISFDAVKHLVLCRAERRPPRLDLDIYPYLPRATVEKTSARAYMRLLDREEEPA